MNQMKQKLLLILILFASMMNAQEQKSYELNPYVNLNDCKNCISENPILYFDKIQNISNKCETLYSKLNSTIIPVEITIDNEGILKKITLYKNVSPIDERLFNNKQVTTFLNSLNGNKIANLNIEKNAILTGKIRIKLDINKLTVINQ